MYKYYGFIIFGLCFLSSIQSAFCADAELKAHESTAEGWLGVSSDPELAGDIERALDKCEEFLRLWHKVLRNEGSQKEAKTIIKELKDIVENSENEEPPTLEVFREYLEFMP